LTELGSPWAFTLAQDGVKSDQNIIVNASVAALQEAGTPEAISLLSDLLVDASQVGTIGVLARALESIGTRDALNGLRRACYTGDVRKADLIRKRLAEILVRSPAFSQLQSANDFAENEQWLEAIDAYGVAMEIDPEMSEASSGRGHCRLHLDQLRPAADDFKLCLSMNPYDSLAITGLAIVVVRQGNSTEGIRMVEDGAEKFPNEWVFAYNAACVYGRALEGLQTEPPSLERDARTDDLEKGAITWLQRSIERGFDQFDYMKRDPDLATLTNLEAFQKLPDLANQPKAP
ncbi:MAG: hypothetical protein KF861_05300, partial [Planctomycetaceae bacterium]|nr:hypothetical protein [Planctomycetaceae bacterium]